MAYLGQFMSLGAVNRALINLAACIFAAFLASVVPIKLGSPFTNFGSIVRESMGYVRKKRKSDTRLYFLCIRIFNILCVLVFLDPIVLAITHTSCYFFSFGLGIAWNIFLGGIFAPEEMNAKHVVGLAGYLALVALITFRVAAQVEHTEEPTTIDRLWILLTFAMQTATAFTLVAFISALTADGWMGHIENLFILLLFAALISTLVARVDVNALNEQDSDDEDEQNCGLDHLPCVLKLLIFVPCLWLCCPWVPLVFLLSGVNGVGIKEKWFQVSNMIGGLAASIEASGMITEGTDQIAATVGFCNEKHCNSPWTFVLLQAVVALITTIVLIPLLVPVVPDFLLPPYAEDEPEIVDEEIPRRKTPMEFITAIPSDTISLLSGPSSKYSSV
ncbi:MAG: hypothetical protein ACI8RD_009158 [Bacillariaceae sp.]|jgi:hypothetical protein